MLPSHSQTVSPQILSEEITDVTYKRTIDGWLLALSADWIVCAWSLVLGWCLAVFAQTEPLPSRSGKQSLPLSFGEFG